MASLIAEEATRRGYPDFAKAIESALGRLLAILPSDEQRQALRLSYEMAVMPDDPQPQRLRLVYSRD